MAAAVGVIKLAHRQRNRKLAGSALQKTNAFSLDRLPTQVTSVKLAQLNKVDADLHPMVVWFFDVHPPFRQRLAQAQAWTTGSGADTTRITNGQLPKQIAVV